MDGKILVTLGDDTQLEILGEEGDWLKVGLTGFVSKKFVSTGEDMGSTLNS